MRRPFLAALAFALPLLACTSREVPIGPEPAADRPVVEAPHAPGGGEVPLPKPANGVLPPGAADAVLPAGSPPIVRLLDAGAAPRSDLSYAMTKGSTQRMAMAMDMTMSVQVQGQTAPQMPMPRMTMTFDTNVADKNAAGEGKIESRLTATSVDPSGAQQEKMAQALRPQLDGMKGLGMSYWVDPKGHVHDVKVDIPAGMPPAAQQLMSGMSQSFESMVTPLPTDPVGVGARWQVVSRMGTGGADILQSAIYTLKSRSGNRATLDVTLVQLAASDTIHPPNAPQAMVAKIRGFNSSGTGSSKVDLTSPAPEGGAMALKTGMDLTVQNGSGQSDDSSVETTTTVTVTRP